MPLHTRGIQLAAVIYNLHHTAAPEIVADTREIIQEAVDRMQSEAPVIDLPSVVQRNGTAVWDDEGLQSLLRYA